MSRHFRALLTVTVAAAWPLPSARAAPTLADHAASNDPWLGRDKALHFAASAGLVGVGYATTALATTDPGHRLGAAAALAFGAGIGKEVADRYRGGDPSWRDLTWDAIGTASGLVVAWLLDRYVF